MKALIVLLLLSIAILACASDQAYGLESDRVAASQVVCGSDILDVASCDLVADGQADQETIQQGIASLGTGGWLALKGTFNTSGSIILDRPLTVSGTGAMSTRINASDATINMIVVATDAGVTIRELRLHKVNIGTDGAGILIEGATPNSYNQGSTVDDIICERQWICIDTNRSAHGKLMNSTLRNYQKWGIWLRNTVAPDVGNWNIYGNTFSAANSEADIYQESAGGAKISMNKMIFGGIGYYLNVAPGVASSITILTDNTIEQKGQHAVLLSSQGGRWSQIMINSNQLMGLFNSTVKTDSDKVGIVTINGNTVRVVGHNSGIELVQGYAYAVGGNVIHGGAGNTIGVEHGTAMQGITVADNQCWSITVCVQ